MQNASFQAADRNLALEVLDDDLIHFEISRTKAEAIKLTGIPNTIQVAKRDYTGPSTFTRNGNILETAELRVSVAPDTLCMTITDKTRSVQLTMLCPYEVGSGHSAFSLARDLMENAYGLGQQFNDPNQPILDWAGQQRQSGNEFGNKMVPFDESGNVGNTQIPMLYAVGPQGANYGLFLDDIYAEQWDFRGSPWNVTTTGDIIRGYILSGPNLPDLRQDYLELVGRPPVPPMKMFGLWVSQFGYRDWGDLEEKLRSLRDNHFPVDGFVLDVQWFGGITEGSDSSNMGRLRWDETNFPNAPAKIAEYADQFGVGFVAIEEPYISKGLPEHEDLESRGFLVRACAGCSAAYLDYNPWWGKGGMIDWTQDAAGDYWHDQKRQKLIGSGILGHWTDLGEPEQFVPSDWAVGVIPERHSHADYHNLYAFKWVESIARGYQRHGTQRRPFILSRSGAAGIQRFGTAMWSGDIAGKFRSLAAHYNAQTHMSMSGMDYYGSDIGGFYRQQPDTELKDLYTRWFASGMWTDVPGRPHTFNLKRDRSTAPDRIGDAASNLANVRQRYELVPYVYSLAHRAHLYGEPVFPPLVYYYQDDHVAREIGNEKLIGKDILVALPITPNVESLSVYLPAGDWANYHTGKWFHSKGQWLSGQSCRIDGILRAPVFARAGAILPKTYVDDKTMNVLGKRLDGSKRNELILRIYPAVQRNAFTLYEDDGETVGYLDGAVQTTAISQQLTPHALEVTIGAAQGQYPGALQRRNTVVEIATEGKLVTSVTLNDSRLEKFETRDAFDRADAGWFDAGHGLVVAKLGDLSVGLKKRIEFQFRFAQDVESRRQ